MTLRKTLNAMAVACLTPILMAGCSSNPATGGADMVVMTQGKEVKIGKEMYDEIIAKGGSYDDIELQLYVDKIGQRLVANSGDAKSQKFTFTVVNDPGINAFATPGGFVYVNRGLLGYLDSEAELAGVMAHEIAHVTARHAARQQTASIGNSVLSGLAYILTRSGDVAEASKMAGNALVAGYGRDMELEADGYGAEYMHLSGYDTDALIGVIGVLKDQETYARSRAKAAGKPSGTYHGTYSTHPRNDARLQQVIRASQNLEGYPENPAIPGEFKRRTENMAYGPSTLTQVAPNRFYHRKLSFSFEHPPGWTVQAASSAVIARSPDGKESVTLTIAPRDRETTTDTALRERASGDTLSPPEALEQPGVTGHTALASDGSRTRRLSVIDYSGLTYTLEGQTSDQGNFQAADERFVALTRSFRPMSQQEKAAPREGHTLHWVQVKRGWTFEKLASISPIKDAENQLRLLNGYYPKGEPRTGDWIKVVQ